MKCNCAWTEKIVGLLVIIFAWWQINYFEIILTVIGVLLILHAFTCRNMCEMGGKNMSVVKSATSRKRI